MPTPVPISVGGVARMLGAGARTPPLLALGFEPVAHPVPRQTARTGPDCWLVGAYIGQTLYNSYKRSRWGCGRRPAGRAAPAVAASSILGVVLHASGVLYSARLGGI